MQGIYTCKNCGSLVVNLAVGLASVQGPGFVNKPFDGFVNKLFDSFIHKPFDNFVNDLVNGINVTTSPVACLPVADPVARPVSDPVARPVCYFCAAGYSSVARFDNWLYLLICYAVLAWYWPLCDYG